MQMFFYNNPDLRAEDKDRGKRKPKEKLEEVQT